MQNKKQIPEYVEGIIYKITCSATLKSYVGQTLTHRWNHGKWRPYGINRRLSAHISCARAGYNSVICEAIRANGEECFSIAELFRCALSERDDKEKQAILSEQTLQPNGYNAALVGAYVVTGSKRRSVNTEKKTEVRKRTHDAAFKTDAASGENTEPVLKAYIREQAGVSPKFSVFLETATQNTQSSMRRTTFSATSNRDSAIQKAREFALRYTQNIDFVPRTEGKSRSQANQEKIISALGNSVLKIRAYGIKEHIALYFETAAASQRKQMMRTSFLYSTHGNDKTKTMHAAREWAKANFQNAEFVKCGEAAQEIHDDALEEE